MMTAAHWNSLPLFAHVDGAEYGEGLSREQAEFLATSHRIVVLGKWIGHTTHGSAEAGNAVALRQLKDINPDVQVYCFWAIKDQFGWFYDSAKIERMPSDFVLRTREGSDYVSMAHHPEVLAWNTANPAMRDWWVSTIMDRVLGGGFDGLLVDGIKPYIMRSHELAAAVGDDVAAEVGAGVDTLLADLREKLSRSGIPIVYNGIKTSPLWSDGGVRYLDSGLADGVMLESFGCGTAPSHEPASMATDMELVSSIDRRGKVVVFGAKADTRPDPADSVKFSLVCFLCCAGSNSYFRMPLPDVGREALAPYVRPIGAPRSPAERDADGIRWRREFEHVSVEVDIASGAAHLHWADDR